MAIREFSRATVFIPCEPVARLPLHSDYMYEYAAGRVSHGGSLHCVGDGASAYTPGR